MWGRGWHQSHTETGEPSPPLAATAFSVVTLPKSESGGCRWSYCTEPRNIVVFLEIHPPHASFDWVTSSSLKTLAHLKSALHPSLTPTTAQTATTTVERKAFSTASLKAAILLLFVYAIFRGVGSCTNI